MLYLHLIRKAIQAAIPIWIQYRDQKNRLSKRCIFPLAITHSRSERIKVEAECWILFEDRSFFLDRIEQLAIAAEPDLHTYPDLLLA
jgi:predicted DNA-binding transcriptional regulator YafY